MTVETLSPLELGRKISQERMRERIALGLPARKTPIEKAKEKPDSCRRAITAKCYECVGMEGDPNFRESIRSCTGYSCPLYDLRPYQKKTV